MDTDLLFISFMAVALVFLGSVVYITLVEFSFCRALLSSDAEIQLDISPKQLEIWHISFVILLLVLKSVAQVLNIGPKLTFADYSSSVSTHEASTASGKTFRLLGSHFRISMPLRIDKMVINKYEAAVDTTLDVNDISTEQIGLIWSSASEAAMLLLLAKPTCPIRPLGAVNVRNRFEISDPLQCRTALLDPLAMPTYVDANLIPTARQVKRGYEFDLKCDVICQESKSVIFRQTFTMLEFAQHAGQAVTSKTEKLDLPSKTTGANANPSAGIETSFGLAFRDPSLWAEICKDYNPIHISKYAARCFGFRGKIAHGNHVVAKALAAMTRSSSQRATNSSGQLESYSTQRDIPTWIEVDFKRPMTVPSNFVVKQFKEIGSNSSFCSSFDVFQKERVCVNVRLGDIGDTLDT